MSDATLDRGIYFYSTMTDWYRERPFKVAFAVSVLVHAILIALIPGFRSVPIETPQVLEVQINREEIPPLPAVQEKPVAQPKVEKTPELPPKVVETPVIPPPVQEKPVVVPPKPLERTPEPVVAPRPEPVPEPVVKQAPQPEPPPIPRTNIIQAPRTERQPEFVVPKPELHPEPKAEPRLESRPEPKMEPRPEVPPVARTEPRPEPRPQARTEPRVEPRADPRPEPRPEPKVAVTPDVKPVPREVAPPVVPQQREPAVSAPAPAPSAPVAPPPVTSAPVVPQAPVTAPQPKAPPPQPKVDEGRERNLIEKYQQDVSARIKQFEKYPLIATRRHWEGTTVVQLVVASDGKVTGVSIVESSGHEILDEAAVKMIREASPLPPLPEGLRGRDRTIQVPIKFKLE